MEVKGEVEGEVVGRWRRRWRGGGCGAGGTRRRGEKKKCPRVVANYGTIVCNCTIMSGKMNKFTLVIVQLLSRNFL